MHYTLRIEGNPLLSGHYTLGSDAKCQVKGVTTTGPSWMEQTRSSLGGL